MKNIIIAIILSFAFIGTAEACHCKQMPNKPEMKKSFGKRHMGKRHMHKRHMPKRHEGRKHEFKFGPRKAH